VAEPPAGCLVVVSTLLIHILIIITISGTLPSIIHLLVLAAILNP
jgi:hypothetical protein